MKPVTVLETADKKYWIKRYEFEGMEAEANAVALMPNGDIVIAGSISEDKKDAKSSGLVARLDREGNVKWVRILGGSNDDKFSDVKVAPNGDIIVAGYTYSFGAGKEDFWVLRLDANGNVKWQKTYGGEYEDEAYAVTIATNGDVIVVGYTESFGAGWPIWVLRLDANGNVKWQKTYGGSGWDVAFAVTIADNGDIIVAGGTKSFSAGWVDVWVLRLDENGNVKWQKTYGGSGGANDANEAHAVAITPNGDIIVAGYTESFGAGWPIWVLRLDENGNVKWQKTYGGSSIDEAHAVAVAENGDVIVAGWTESFGAGGKDAWVFRLDENGNVKWQKTYGGNSDDKASAVAIAPNGDVIVAGDTYSFGAGGKDAWVLRLQPNGELSNCNICQDSDAIVMDTNAVVKNTNCKVTVPPLKPGFSHREYVKITETSATVRSVVPKVEVLCEWSPEKSARGVKKPKRMKPCPGYLINGRCYIVRATVIDKTGLKSALEELDKELSSIGERHSIQPLPDEITVHPFKGIIEGKNLFVTVTNTMNMVSRGPRETGLRLSEWRAKILGKILDRIRNTVIPEIEVSENVSEGVAQSLPETKAKKPEVKAKTAPKISKVPKVPEKAKPIEETKTVEGFPTALLGRYEPLQFIGEGSFTKVFKARRREDDKIVALKILKINEKDDKRELVREVTNKWLPLDHPNIVRLYEVNVQPVPYLELEFVDGEPLDRYPKPTDEKTALKIMMGIAQALRYAHSRGIHHGNLTPLNVLLTRDMTPKIEEWGLNGYTPLYASPEHLDEHSDTKTDIWQFGVIFYELVTGKLPFSGATIAELVMSIKNKNPSKPSELNPKARIFDEIIMKCLKKRKEDRYQSVDELLRDLEKVGRSLGIKLPQASTYYHTPEHRKLQKRVSNWGGQAYSDTYTTEAEIEGFPSALLESYEPLEFLGEGGFAKVFKARRKEDGRVVALKIPRIDEKTGKFFIKEVASWYQLNHPNIVTLYEANVYPLPYIEMEFVEGVEVDGKLVRDLDKYPKPVDEETALKLITGIAEGLNHAHSKGIYHLDLKPLNILLKANLTPKITDWGLAKISARSSLSKHYGYSPLYAAPEQLDEETFGTPDRRTDIYQLGLVFYELLTDELPYTATSPAALIGKILHAKPRPISELKPELKKFDGIFEKLLAKRKEERYQSVEEFLSALESLGELEREKEELRKTSLAMKKSRSREEFERLRIESVRKTVKIAILSARLNDKAELLTALDDLKFYTRENLDDLLNAIAQIEMLTKEGIPISPETEERIKALVLRIEGEALR